MPSHIKIECDGLLGHHGRIVYVSRDGVETDISDVVNGAEVRVKLGANDLNTATLHVIKTNVHVAAVAEQIETELDKRMRRRGNR